MSREVITINADVPRDMQLPTGKTCADCVHTQRCVAMFDAKPTNTHCDWSPHRFRQRRVNAYRIGPDTIAAYTLADAAEVAAENACDSARELIDSGDWSWVPMCATVIDMDKIDQPRITMAALIEQCGRIPCMIASTEY